MREAARRSRGNPLFALQQLHAWAVSGNMKLVDGKKVSLLEWTYDNGALDFILRGTDPLDASAFIEMFERSGMFVEVSGTLTNQERELRMKTRIKRIGAES